MRSPFPGMDPYLERHWRDVHHGLTTYCRDQLQPRLPDSLRARMEERGFVEADDGTGRWIGPDVRIVRRATGRATAGRDEDTAGAAVAMSASPIVVADPIILSADDEPIVETSVHIIDLAAGSRVVTVIEFVSPTNKTRGDGRDLYLRKRAECFAAGVNFVEIDLTRLGDRHADFLPFSLPADDRETYLAWARRASPPRHYEIYPLRLRDRLPAIRVPLRETDADTALELQPLVDQCYRNGGFDDIDYRQEPPARLAPADAAWADQLLRAAGVR